MSKNKTSVWSIIILVATIITLVLVATTVTLTIIGMPTIIEAARQEATRRGATAAEVDAVVAVAYAAIIGGLVLGCAFDVLKIIGGFFFSLKGRWGVFCIVVSIISVAAGIYVLISNITNKAGVGNIVVSSIELAVGVLLVVACFKHKAEIAE